MDWLLIMFLTYNRGGSVSIERLSTQKECLELGKILSNSYKTNKFYDNAALKTHCISVEKLKD